jgi:hypothetical protein
VEAHHLLQGGELERHEVGLGDVAELGGSLVILELLEGRLALGLGTEVGVALEGVDDVGQTVRGPVVLVRAAGVDDTGGDCLQLGGLRWGAQVEEAVDLRPEGAGVGVGRPGRRVPPRPLPIVAQTRLDLPLVPPTAGTAL